ncbi:MAG: class I SAM-dependent methyltransferase [Gemmatimonadales bacterium]|nr:class I SAM-dependent methyltransferase [Gemmatimonadales bacterium]
MAPAGVRPAVRIPDAPHFPGAAAYHADREYRPFPNEEGRNSRQESLEVPLMIRALGLPSHGRVLEIGCGRGVALPVLDKLLRPSRLVGLDVEADFLDEARLRLAHAGATAELVPADVRRMPFPDAAFDLVIDFGTCYHIARPEIALEEIARVLAPGGLVVHETPLSQLLSHPLRSFNRRIPWSRAPMFERQRTAVLWTSRRRRPTECTPRCPAPGVAAYRRPERWPPTCRGSFRWRW